MKNAIEAAKKSLFKGVLYNKTMFSMHDTPYHQDPNLQECPIGSGVWVKWPGEVNGRLYFKDASVAEVVKKHFLGEPFDGYDHFNPEYQEFFRIGGTETIAGLPCSVKLLEFCPELKTCLHKFVLDTSEYAKESNPLFLPIDNIYMVLKEDATRREIKRLRDFFETVNEEVRDEEQEN